MKKLVQGHAESSKAESLKAGSATIQCPCFRSLLCWKNWLNDCVYGAGEDKREKGRPGTSTMVSTLITGREAGCFTRPEDLRTQVDSFLEWGWG